MEGKSWFDPGGRSIDFQDLIEIIASFKREEIKIFVGTDSHKRGTQYIFATALCLWHVGYGGKYFILRTHRPKSEFRILHNRLLHEVQQSLDVADSVRSIGYDVCEIHVDANKKDNVGSKKSAALLESYVTSNGFSCKLKPEDAWAASAVADKHAR